MTLPPSTAAGSHGRGGSRTGDTSRTGCGPGPSATTGGSWQGTLTERQGPAPGAPSPPGSSNGTCGAPTGVTAVGAAPRLRRWVPPLGHWDTAGQGQQGTRGGHSPGDRGASAAPVPFRSPLPRRWHGPGGLPVPSGMLRTGHIPGYRQSRDHGGSRCRGGRQCPGDHSGSRCPGGQQRPGGTARFAAVTVRSRFPVPGRAARTRGIIPAPGAPGGGTVAEGVSRLPVPPGMPQTGRIIPGRGAPAAPGAPRCGNTRGAHRGSRQPRRDRGSRCPGGSRGSRHIAAPGASADVTDRGESYWVPVPREVTDRGDHPGSRYPGDWHRSGGIIRLPMPPQLPVPRGITRSRGVIPTPGAPGDATDRGAHPGSRRPGGCRRPGGSSQLPVPG